MFVDAGGASEIIERCLPKEIKQQSFNLFNFFFEKARKKRKAKRKRRVRENAFTQPKQFSYGK